MPPSPSPSLQAIKHRIPTRLYSSWSSNPTVRKFLSAKSLAPSPLGSLSAATNTVLPPPLEPKRRAQIPKVSLLGDIKIPGASTIRPDPAPSKNVRPNLAWISDDLTGVGHQLSFSQKQAARRMEELKRKADPLYNPESTSMATSVSTALPNTPENHRAGVSSRQRRLFDVGAKHNLEKVQLVSEALEQELLLRVNKRKQDLEYEKERQVQKQTVAGTSAAIPKAASRAEMQTRKGGGKAKKKQIEKARPSRPAIFYTDYEAVIAAMTPKLPQTVQEEIESIQAAHASSLSPKSTVEALLAARVQKMKERAGDYSQFLPSHLVVDGSPRGPFKPVDHARLVLSRVPGIGLGKRQKAIAVVERLVKAVTEEKLVA